MERTIEGWRDEWREGGWDGGSESKERRKGKIERKEGRKGKETGWTKGNFSYGFD